MRFDDRPWASLPDEAADVLRPELPGLADEIIAAVSAEVSEYRRPLEGPFGTALRTGVEAALARFLDLMVRDEPGPDPGREIYVGLGRGEQRAGRSLDALLSAYRLGARVSWRRLAAAGEAAGLDPNTLYLLAESIFAYIDEISGESIEGYTNEQAAAAGERQRLRRRVAGLLIQTPSADPAAIEGAARDAGWELPTVVAAIVAEGDDPDRLALSLGADVIAQRHVRGVVALVPDPDAPGRRGQLAAAMGDRRAAIGPAGGWQRAYESARRADLALDMAEPGELVDCEARALDLLLGSDPALAEDIAARALEPLAEETAGSQRRLSQTLAAWLRHRGRTEQIAAELHVHPQTVRYRMGRLRELFGDRLESPDGRFELELALRVADAATE